MVTRPLPFGSKLAELNPPPLLAEIPQLIGLDEFEKMLTVAVTR